MTIINQATHGEKTYVVSLHTGIPYLDQFRVAAYNETEAADLVADFLESKGFKGLYYLYDEVEIMALCAKYVDANEYAEAHNLTCCGNHGIYVGLADVQEVCYG